MKKLLTILLTMILCLIPCLSLGCNEKNEEQTVSVKYFKDASEMIPMLKKFKVGQTILVYVKEHEGKNGTPTMGGLFFVFAIILFGAIQARIYTESGAALSIAETAMNAFMKNDSSSNKKQIVAILLITLIGTILAFGGIITTVVIILLYITSIKLIFSI